MNILVTGARGFIGKNRIAELTNIKEGKAKRYSLTSDLTLFEYDIDTDPALLDGYCREADFVFHLAGVNRPKEQSEFMEGNFGFTSLLLDTLKKQGNYCPVMLSSSIQAELVNPYGISKKAGEDLLFEYGRETGADVLIYRFPNVFGKWCRPNYNSAVATFCHNIAHNLPIQVNDRNVHSTYLSYLPEDQFSYPLKMNVDERGSFTAFLKSPDRGQVSVNISKPGITKGQHWHHTKNEKFLVVSGKGVIRFRKIDDENVLEYFVSGDKLEVVDIPVGYTHNIENLGETDMVTVMWVNEVFDPEHPDTYFLPV